MNKYIHRSFLASVLVLIFILSIVGCAPRTTSVGLKAKELALIAAEIDKHPGEYKEILKKHDLSYEQFEKALREVTENPGMARTYSEVYEEITN